MIDQINWDEVRRQRYAEGETPADWPKGVRAISIKGVGLLGVHPATNRLYWDGQELVTEKRLNNFERGMAFAVTIATVVVAAIEVGRAAGWIAD